MKRKNVDMLSGPVLKNVLIFSIPIVLSGLLQLFYNAADMIVVGRYAESGSLAAVGSTGSIINLFVNVFMGVSVGTCVVVAKALGSGDSSAAKRAVQTSVLVALIAGFVVGVFGFCTARPLLQMMETPDDVIDRAVTYVKIYYLGMPANMLLNFGSAAMRATGDTRRPLRILSISGIINVLLNLFLVIVFKLGVAGVAIGTIVAQFVSAVLVVSSLVRSAGVIKLDLKRMKLHKAELIQILKIGIPAGIQGSVFSISNVLIQSSINSFGSIAMEGSAASANIENFIYTSMNSVSQASLTFTGQCYGASAFKRMNKVLASTTLVVSVVGITMGAIACVFNAPLLKIYITTPEPILFGKERLLILGSTYFMCGIMETMAGSMRGIGYSTVPLIVSVFGACISRIIWIFTVFASHRTLEVLYLSYPISWFLTFTVHFLCFMIAKKRLEKRYFALEKIQG